MPTAKPTLDVMWSKAILTLAGNIGVMFVPVFFRKRFFSAIIQPLTTIIFLMEGLMFLLTEASFFDHSDLGSYTGGLICVMFVIICAVVESFLPGSNSTGVKGGDPSKPSQYDDDFGTLSQNPANGSLQTGKPDSAEYGNFQIFTLFVVVIMWITYLLWGIREEMSQGFWWFRDGKFQLANINSIFSTLFRFATLQFVFGMWVIKDSPPNWLYFFYMVPLAVLNPLGMIVSFYVHRNDDAIYEASSVFDAMFAGILCYIGFRMMFTFQDQLKQTGWMRDKITQMVVLSVGFLWEVFINGVEWM